MRLKPEGTSQHQLATKVGNVFSKCSLPIATVIALAIRECNLGLRNKD